MQPIENIMKLLRRYHRTTPQSSVSCCFTNKKCCFSRQEEKIKRFIQLSQPITFILPAFPAKSSNREKTAGILPDLGERLALCQLNNICHKIQEYYAPGAHVVICSDGRVFSDLVMVSDKEVDAYAAGIKQIIKEEDLNFLSIFSLDDCYDQLSYDALREAITQEFAEELNSLKYRVKTEEEAKSLFNGIHRFIFEDQLACLADFSKNKIRGLSKEIAYQVIRRSNAWSRLLQKQFPDAVRLSIHPQACGSEKLGIMLLESTDTWATPWHRVVLQNGNNYRLIRKKEAEQLNAKPVFTNNQFSHYII